LQQRHFMTRWFDSNFFLMEKSLNGRATAFKP
jgi:hypothetical protein